MDIAVGSAAECGYALVCNVAVMCISVVGAAGCGAASLVLKWWCCLFVLLHPLKECRVGVSIFVLLVPWALYRKGCRCVLFEEGVGPARGRWLNFSREDCDLFEGAVASVR